MEYGESDAAIGRTILVRRYNFPTIYDAGGLNGIWTEVMCKVFPQSRFELFEPFAEINPDYKAQFTRLKTILASRDLSFMNRSRF